MASWAISTLSTQRRFILLLCPFCSSPSLPRTTQCRDAPLWLWLGLRAWSNSLWPSRRARKCPGFLTHLAGTVLTDRLASADMMMGARPCQRQRFSRALSEPCLTKTDGGWFSQLLRTSISSLPQSRRPHYLRTLAQASLWSRLCGGDGANHLTYGGAQRRVHATAREASAM